MARKKRKVRKLESLRPWTQAELAELERSARENADRDAEADRQDAAAVAEAWALLDKLDGGYTV